MRMSDFAARAAMGAATPMRQQPQAPPQAQGSDPLLVQLAHEHNALEDKVDALVAQVQQLARAMNALAKQRQPLDPRVDQLATNVEQHLTALSTEVATQRATLTQIIQSAAQNTFTPRPGGPTISKATRAQAVRETVAQRPQVTVEGEAQVVEDDDDGDEDSMDGYGGGVDGLGFPE